jgi:hypothetical protein
MNLQFKKEKYSDTYIWDFFTAIFFFLRSLGAEAAPEALADIAFSSEGGVCLSEATAMVTKAVAPAEGCDCPGAVPAGIVNGYTVMEGPPCSLIVSSPLASPTFVSTASGLGG